MKMLKIVIYLFLFVINLSKTFLYKNNLFTTFINGVLQTNGNNLWYRKQIGLAEAAPSSLRGIHEDSNDKSYCYIDRFLSCELNSSISMIESLSSNTVAQRHMLIKNKNIYKNRYIIHAHSEGINVSDDDAIRAYNRFRNHLYINRLDDLIENKNKIIEKIIMENKVAKDLLYLYLNESDHFKIKIFYGNKIVEYINTYSPNRTSDFNISYSESYGAIYYLVLNIIDKLKREKIIS